MNVKWFWQTYHWRTIVWYPVFSKEVLKIFLETILGIMPKECPVNIPEKAYAGLPEGITKK